MTKFKNLIILSPLAYVLHHFEEHIIFNFRDWRLTYFQDNNSLSTEEILVRLLVVLLIFIFVHSVRKNKGSAHVLLYFLMTTQVVNVFFHIFFSLYFLDFSPGVITGILFYLPINYLIFKAAINEGLLNNTKEIAFIFVLGVSTFALFEYIGPVVMQISFLLSITYYFFSTKYIHSN